MQHEVGHTRNNIPVYVNLTRSSAAKQIAQQPNLLSLAKEALKRTHARGPHPIIECDMGRSIGYSYIMETSSKDTIFYARVANDELYTRFVKKGEPLSTQYLTFVLHSNGKGGSYVLSDIWIGRKYPERPGSPEETEEGRNFWENHAHILQNEQLKHGSTTKVCPW